VPKQWLVENDFGEWTAEIQGDRIAIPDAGATFSIRDASGERIGLEDRSGSIVGVVGRSAGTIWVAIDGEVFACRVSTEAEGHGPAARGHDVLTPPMPATVVRIAVRPGDHVSAGDTLIVLEAMKMELPIRAPRDATVAAVHCVEGQLVQPDHTLLDLEP